MSEFKINNDADVFLYGAASIGKIVYETLVKYGIMPKGFIDKRADELEDFMGVPVYSINDFPNSENSVIIISVKNVFEHNDIIAEFIRLGHYNLVYMPQDVLNGGDDEKFKVIANTYNDLLAGKLDTNKVMISTEECVLPTIRNCGVIENRNGVVKLLIPATYLFTNNYDITKHKWGNINVLAFFTHIGFFRYLSGDNNYSYEDYLTHYCEYTAKIQGDIKITDKWKQNVLRNRAMIYRKMNNSFYFDKDFFVRSSAEAEYNNEKRMFNLTSGKHRTMFLIAKGYEYVPVAISEEDYYKFLNKEAVEKMEQYMINAKLRTVDNIANPFFYDFPRNDSGAEFAMISWVSFYLAKELYAIYDRVEFAQLSVQGLINEYGSIMRHFARMGAEVCCEDEPTEYQSLINDIEKITICQNKRSKKRMKLYLGSDFDSNEGYTYIISKKMINDKRYEQCYYTESILGEHIGGYYFYRRV